MPEGRQRIKLGEIGPPDQRLLKRTTMRPSAPQARMAKAGCFKAAAIEVASRQIEIQTIDFSKLQSAEVLGSCGQRRTQLDEIAGLLLH
jgi:hypothetical protein